MSQAANVPLNAPGKPRVLDGKIGGPENRIPVEDVPSLPFVKEGPEPPAKGRDKFGPQEIVLHNDGRKLHFPQNTVVAILFCIGKKAEGGFPPEGGPRVFGKTIAPGNGKIRAGVAEKGLGISAAHRRSPEPQCISVYRRHAIP